MRQKNKEIDELESKLKKAREALKRCKQGMINLIDAAVLPHEGWDLATTEEIDKIEQALEDTKDD